MTFHLTCPAANHDTEQGHEQQLVVPDKRSERVPLHNLSESQVTEIIILI